MVPNHMGIDSRWVIEHPDWFLSLPEPPYPAYTLQRRRTSRRTSGSGSSSRTTTGTTATRRWSSSASTAASGDERYVYHGNDGTSFPWNDTAQLDYLQARGPRGGHPDDPRRRPALPDHPLRRGDDPRQEAHPAAVVPAPGSGGGIPSRAEHAHDPGRVRRRDAGRVLARGGRPGRRRGARHAAAGRGVLADGGLLRPDAGHAPRLQQRLHAHAPRRGQRGVPPG